MQVRGPVTLQLTRALEALLGAITTVTDVKFVRFWAVDDSAARALASALLTVGFARSTAPPSAPFTVSFQKKGTSGASFSFGAPGHSTHTADEVVAAVVTYSAPPPT